MGRSASIRGNRSAIETLESRQMLSVTPAQLEAEGFEKITWQGQEAFARPGQWIVQIDDLPGAAQEQLARVNQRLAAIRGDVRATRQLGKDGLFLMETPKGVGHAELQRSLAGPRGLRGLRTIEPDFALWAETTIPTDSAFGSQWALHNTGQTGGATDADIDAPEAWDLARGNGSVVVGVIDSGIDYTHPDLAANIWRNPGETAGNGIDDDRNGYVDDVYGWDFYNNDANPMDDNGHGTHVAGTIAAAGNNGTGVAGVNWNAKVMALKFLGANGSGSMSAALAAINYATKMRSTYGINVRVTNNSWGGGAYSSTLYNAINDGGNAGILFIAAAGNGGSDGIGDNNDTAAFYPASYNLNSVISVAASDHIDRLGSFSNYGTSSVDLAAPGVSILSTTRGGGYGRMSGTSMATPHVSGVAALAWSMSPSASIATMRDALLKGVDSRPTLTGKVATGGRLSALGTLKYLQQVQAAPAAPSGLSATAGSSTRVDLAWLDNSSNESGFSIHRSSDGASYSHLANVGAGVVRYSDTTATAGRSYWYYVRAYNTVGTSAVSNTASVTTPAPAVATTVPAAPTSLTARAISSSQIQLAWADNSGNEDGFKVERWNGSSWVLLGTLGKDVTGAINSGLASNTTYSYRIRAYNAAGSSAYTNIASARTLIGTTTTYGASVFSSSPLAAGAGPNHLLLGSRPGAPLA